MWLDRLKEDVQQGRPYDSEAWRMQVHRPLRLSRLTWTTCSRLALPATCHRFMSICSRFMCMFLTSVLEYRSMTPWRIYIPAGGELHAAVVPPAQSEAARGPSGGHRAAVPHPARHLRAPGPGAPHRHAAGPGAGDAYPSAAPPNQLATGGHLTCAGWCRGRCCRPQWALMYLICTGQRDLRQ